MFLLKDTLNKANICPHLSKLHFKYREIEKHGQDADPGISVKLELADLKKNDKASDNQILKFYRFCELYVTTYQRNHQSSSP